MKIYTDFCLDCFREKLRTKKTTFYYKKKIYKISKIIGSSHLSKDKKIVLVSWYNLLAEYKGRFSISL